MSVAIEYRPPTTNAAARLYESVAADLGYQVGRLTGPQLADVYQEYTSRWDRYQQWQHQADRVREIFDERTDQRLFHKQIRQALQEGVDIRPVVYVTQEYGFTWERILGVLAGSDARSHLFNWWSTLEDWEAFQEFGRSTGNQIERRELRRYVRAHGTPTKQITPRPDDWPYGTTVFYICNMFGFQLTSNGKPVTIARNRKTNNTKGKS